MYEKKATNGSGARQKCFCCAKKVSTLNCCPCSRSFSQRPAASIHSPAVTDGMIPTTATRSRKPFLSKPLESFCNVWSTRGQFDNVTYKKNLDFQNGKARFVALECDPLHRSGEGLRGSVSRLGHLRVHGLVLLQQKLCVGESIWKKLTERPRLSRIPSFM